MARFGVDLTSGHHVKKFGKGRDIEQLVRMLRHSL